MKNKRRTRWLKTNTNLNKKENRAETKAENQSKTENEDEDKAKAEEKSQRQRWSWSWSEGEAEVKPKPKKRMMPLEMKLQLMPVLMLVTTTIIITVDQQDSKLIPSLQLCIFYQSSQRGLCRSSRISFAMCWFPYNVHWYLHFQHALVSLSATEENAEVHDENDNSDAKDGDEEYQCMEKTI